MGPATVLSGKYIFLALIIILTIAVLLGADLNTSNWMSPPIANAQAGQIQAATAQQAEQAAQQSAISQAEAELKIAQLKAEQLKLAKQTEQDLKTLDQQAVLSDLQRQAELQAEQQRIRNQAALMQAQLDAQIADLRSQQEEHEMRQKAITIALIAGLSVGGLLILALGACLMMWALNKTKLALAQMQAVSFEQSQALPADPWQDEEYRETAIEIARYNERKSNAIKLAAQKAAQQGMQEVNRNNGNGHRDETQTLQRKSTLIFRKKQDKDWKDRPLAG
jgi:hypothetical protein